MALVQGLQTEAPGKGVENWKFPKVDHWLGEGAKGREKPLALVQPGDAPVQNRACRTAQETPGIGIPDCLVQGPNSWISPKIDKGRSK